MAQFFFFPPSGGSTLPPGAATAANQVLEIAALNSIDGKTPALGQALAAGSTPVVLTAAQLTTLTPLSTVTVIQPTGTNLHVVVDSSALPSGAATAANQATEIASLSSIDSKLTSPLTVTGPLTDAQLRASPVPVSGTVSTGGLTDAQLRASAVPVSAASLPLPTGAATAANQATEIASLSSIDSKLTSPLTVTGPLTDTQLRATPVPVSGTVTANAGSGTFAISAASLPLPSGAATEATLSSLNGKVTAVNTGAVVVSSSALPSGASTSALQTTISGQLPATLGQKTSAASLAVVLASDQSTINSKSAGKAKVDQVRYDYSSPVTTAAYVTLIASTAAACSEIFIFDSSGETLVIAVGAAASEVDQVYIVPGGNGPVPLAIPSGARVSIKAVTATASVGYLAFYSLA